MIFVISLLLLLTKPLPEARWDSRLGYFKKVFAKLELRRLTMIEDEDLMNVFVLKTKQKLFFANYLPSFYFLLSDSSALDTQVFSHYYHQPCAFVILLHVHVFVHTFVLCLVV